MELASVIVRPLCIAFERSWQSRELCEDWQIKKCYFCLQEEKCRGYGELQAGQHHLSPWKGGGTNSPENHFQASGGQKGSSMHKFKKGKQCLTYLDSLYSEVVA